MTNATPPAERSPATVVLRGDPLAPVETVMHERADDVAGLRAGEVEALTEIAPDLLQRRELAGGLDAFGRDRQPERVPEMDDRLDD